MTRAADWANAHRARGDDPWHLIERLYAKLDKAEFYEERRCRWIGHVPDGKGGWTSGPCSNYARENYDLCPQRTALMLLTHQSPHTANLPLCMDHADEYEERAQAYVNTVPRARRQVDTSAAVVYYLQRHDGMVKIGTTIQLEKRLAQFRTSLGTTFTLLATEPGHTEREMARHQQFAAAHQELEWFRPEPALMAHIAALTPAMRAGVA